MKKLKKHLILIVLVLFIGFIYIYGPTYAKYISNSFWDYYLKTKGFYLSSDNLNVEKINNIDNMWNGNRVYFNVKNNLNQNVITSYDISYEALCTVKGEASNYIKCSLNGTSNSKITGNLVSVQSCINNKDSVDVSSLNKADCELSGYNWENQISTNNLYFDLLLTDENYDITDVTVNVTITSTNPYKKSLTGDFILHKIESDDNKIVSKYDNYSYYDRLTITNMYEVDKCVSVKWNDDLIIDADVSKFISYETYNDYINDIVIKIPTKSNISELFYNRNENIYTIDNFTIEEVNCQ